MFSSEMRVQVGEPGKKPQGVFIKGVNLGGWLVLERWLTKNLFEYYDANSEPTLYKHAFKNSQKLVHHFETYINEGDLVYLKEQGINALRLPISHGIFGNFDPIPATYTYVDNFMDWSQKYGFKVLLDLHTVPGGQNGWEVGGKQGNFTWHTEKSNVTDTIKVLSQLAQRYKNFPNLYGIELVNEPNVQIPLSFLKNFYTKGYKAVREHCSEHVAVVIHDSFRPNEWNEFMIEPAFKNVVLDMHLYQCFAPHEKKMPMLEHFNLCSNWSRLIDRVQRNRKAICGEWSLALDEQSFEWLSPEEKRMAIEDYGKAQLQAFTSLQGWFYWTYKLSYASTWNFRHCIENGLIAPLNK